MCPARSSPAALPASASRSRGCCATRGIELTLASRTREKIEAAAEELGALAVAADMSREEDCIRVVAEHKERYGGMNVLVNSAGIGIAGTVESLQAKHIDLQLGVNLRGLLLVSREAIPLLKETRGWIVNLASIAGTAPTPGLTVYGATKAAVIALTRSAEPRARRGRGARDRHLPRLRRHADGAVVGHPEGRDDPDPRTAPRSCGCASGFRTHARIPQVVVERVGATELVG